MRPPARSGNSADGGRLDAEQLGELAHRLGNVADADRAMMGGPMAAPFGDEAPRPDSEAVPAVGIPDLEGRAGHRFTFGEQEPQRTIALFVHRQQRDGTVP